MILGLLLIISAALCGGTFALPMKYVRRFQWENTWLWGSLFTMVILPWAIACLLTHDPVSMVFGGNLRSVLVAASFGFGWGLGTVTFGIGINRIGLSLGYAIVMGVNTALGALLPLLVLSRDSLHTSGGHLILLGIAGCILGVCLCGYAGILKEQHVEEVPTTNRPRRTSLFVRGMLICVLSGVLSAFMNLGFSFAQPISLRATEMGASIALASLATWIAIFTGSFPAVLLCCLWLQFRRSTFTRNVGPGSRRDILLAFVLGLLWFAAILLYGVGAVRLGPMGTSVGWALNVSASLLVANLLGFKTGEWQKAPRRSVRWIIFGLSIVIVSMGILASGNALLGNAFPS